MEGPLPLRPRLFAGLVNILQRGTGHLQFVLYGSMSSPPVLRSLCSITTSPMTKSEKHSIFTPGREVPASLGRSNEIRQVTSETCMRNGVGMPRAVDTASGLAFRGCEI